MGDDSEDYLSDKYLLIEFETSTKKKRKLSCLPINQSNKKISVQNIQEITLKAGEIPIDSSNKGFKLLSRMGYKGEGGLGKNNEGTSEPISIIFRDTKNKEGLGIQEEKNKKLTKFRDELKRLAQLRDDLTADFQSRLNYQHQIKSFKKSIYEAEKVIYEYDSRESIVSNHLWPANLLIEEGAVDDRSELTDLNILDRLEECLCYLRENYQYCLFCGCKFEDDDDLIQNCPGLLQVDH